MENKIKKGKKGKNGGKPPIKLNAADILKRKGDEAMNPGGHCRVTALGGKEVNL